VNELIRTELSDGPGAAAMFVSKHFLPTPPKPE